MAEIKPLLPDVAAQIKSSTTISSLSEVIFGLIQNAFDAWARRIDVEVDFGRASCSVEDDGCGISPADFGEDGGLGRPYRCVIDAPSTISSAADVLRHIETQQ